MILTAKQGSGFRAIVTVDPTIPGRPATPEVPEQVLRTNLATRPNNDVGWASNNSAMLSQGTDPNFGRSSPPAFRQEVLVDDVNVLSSYNSGGGVFDVTPGLPYTASVYTFNTLPGYRGHIFCSFEVGGKFQPAVYGDKVDSIPNEWTRMHVTAVAPAGATRVRTGMFVSRNSGQPNPPIGTVAWADDLLLEQTDQLLPYFDGSTPAADGKLCRWTGDANNSTSEEYIPGVPADPGIPDEPETLTGTMTLWRTANGLRTPVAGIIDVPAEATVVSDVAVPLGVPVVYDLTYSDTKRAEADPIIIDPPQSAYGSMPLVTHPVTGANAVIMIKSWTDLEHESTGTEITIPGRADPIHVADVELTPTSAPELITLTTAEADALGHLAADGTILLIRTPCSTVADAYVAIRSRKTARLSDTSQSPVRVHALTVRHHDMPDPHIRAQGDTLGDLHNAVPGTLGDIAARWPGRLLDIAQDDLQAETSVAALMVGG